MRVVALDTENSIMKATIQSLRFERNQFAKKNVDVDLSNEPKPQQQNSSLPPIPRINNPNSPR
jgi:hypothetical protein